MFDGYIKANIKEGNANIKHKAPLNDNDWEKLMNSDTLNGDNQISLQQKVFVNIMTHFGRRGREGLRDLKKDTYIVKRDENGVEFVERKNMEVSKNHQGLKDQR